MVARIPFQHCSKCCREPGSSLEFGLASTHIFTIRCGALLQVARNRLATNVHILRCCAEDVTLDTVERAIDVVIGEPFFHSGAHFSHSNSKFSHLHSKLSDFFLAHGRSRATVAPIVLLVRHSLAALTRRSGTALYNCAQHGSRARPTGALAAVVAEVRSTTVRRVCKLELNCSLVSLSLSYCPLLHHDSFEHVSLVEGLDLSAFNSVKSDAAFVCSYQMSQYAMCALCDAFSVQRVCVDEALRDLSASGAQPVIHTGIAHAVVVWTDWAVGDACISGAPLDANAPAPTRSTPAAGVATASGRPVMRSTRRQSSTDYMKSCGVI